MQIENLSDKLMIRLSGEIDHHAARTMREQVDSAIERYKPDRLCLDFSGISFMDSSGIGFIMGRYRIMKLYSGSVELTGMSTHIEKMMRLAGLERLGLINSENKERHGVK